MSVSTRIYADAARLKKILFLTGVLDSALSFLKVDPFSAAAFEYVAAMNDAAWVEAAKHASVNLPSTTTRSMIIELYAERVEVRRALRIA